MMYNMNTLGIRASCTNQLLLNNLSSSKYLNVDYSVMYSNLADIYTDTIDYL